MSALDSTAQGRLILWKHGSHPDIGYCAGSQEFANDVLEVLAENAALKAAVRRMDKENSALQAHIGALQAQGLIPKGFLTVRIFGLTIDELAVAQKDAERYRWLREHAYQGITRLKECLWCIRGLYGKDGESFDAAIDAELERVK